MGIAPYSDPNNMECIRCGECVSKCPKKAIKKPDNPFKKKDV